MEISREALLDELNDFEKKRPNDISPVLEDYLLKIAKCGDTMFPWAKFKLLIRKKLEVVMSDFHEESPTDNLPPVPNVELFKFETMKLKILEAVDSFQSTPFTIQRLCELITSPRQHYKRTDKFMRGIEKNILVVSTVEPRHTELNNNNNNSNNGSLVVNGILDGNTDEEMLVSGQQMDNENHLNNNNNASNLLVQQSRVTVNGVPIPDGLFAADPSSSTSATGSAGLNVAGETESSSEDSSDGSTDSGGEYILKDPPLNVIADVAKVAMSSSARAVSCMPLDDPPLPTEDDTVLPLVGCIENASEVEEHARQLLSQVTANIEESTLLEEASQGSSKYPVSPGTIDTNLELGFGLSKELSGECETTEEEEDSKLPCDVSGQFAADSILTQVDDPTDLAVESTSQSEEVAEDEVPSLEVPASEMDPGIITQINGCHDEDEALHLDADCNAQNSDICSSSMDDEDPCQNSEQMETDNMVSEVASSTSFHDADCSPSSKDEPCTVAQVDSSVYSTTDLAEEDSSNLDPSGLEVSTTTCQSQQQQPNSDEPMDQD